MKSYELSLHWKQGDDLAGHLSTMKTPTRALKAWGLSFAHAKRICDEIATAIDGKAVVIEAGTHYIALHPKSPTAKKALEALVAKKLLQAVDTEEE